MKYNEYDIVRSKMKLFCESVVKRTRTLKEQFNNISVQNLEKIPFQ